MPIAQYLVEFYSDVGQCPRWLYSVGGAQFQSLYFLDGSTAFAGAMFTGPARGLRNHAHARIHNPREVAEIVAVQALSFIAGDPERLGLFLAESGIGPETLRTAAADPQFLASVLDFVMRDDATVKAFASASQLHPTNIAAARQVLGDPHWERDVP